MVENFMENEVETGVMLCFIGARVYEGGFT